MDKLKFIEKKVYRELNFTDPPCSCGDFAIDKAMVAPSVVSGRHAPESDLHTKLFLAGCAMVGVKSQDHVQGVMALPLEWAKNDGPGVEKKYSREWKIDNTDFRATIKTGSQGLLAVMNHAIDFDGRALNTDLLNFSIVLDLGGGTADVAEIRDRSVGNRRGSLPGCGINQVSEKVRQALKNAGMFVTPSRARKIVSDRKYLHRGVAVPELPGSILSMLDDLSTAAYGFLTDRIPEESYQEAEKILLTGGAGLDCKSFLTKIDSRFFCGEYPVFDNALGALKKAMRKRNNTDVYIGFDIGNSFVKVARWMGDHVLLVCFRSVVGERIFEENAQ